MFNLGEIIDLAVRIEMNGQKAYRKAQEQVSDPDLSSMLGWLANEKARHEKWFLQFKESAGSPSEDPRLEEMGQKVLQGVLGDRAFSIDEADFSNMEDLNSLLTLSLEFEKDTALFYEMLGAFVEDEKVLEQLEQIRDEEKDHARLLRDFLEGKEPRPISNGSA
jgi:rubrerythrin